MEYETMPSRTEQLNALFVEWRSRASAAKFARDGIIDERAWDSAPRRIVFLAKETNAFDGDLRDLFREKPWAIPGYWAYGLQHARMDLIPGLSEAVQGYRAAFTASAFVNIKKVPGGTAADTEGIKLSAQRDRDLLHRELAIIDPQIVVCCGTFDILRDAGSIPGKILRSNRDDRWYEVGNTVWIDYAHPSAKFDRRMTYYGVVCLYLNYLVCTRPNGNGRRDR